MADYSGDYGLQPTTVYSVNARVDNMQQWFDKLEERVERLEEALKPKKNLAGLAKPKPVTRGYNEADDSYTLGYEDYLQLNKELDALRDENRRLKERLDRFTSLVRGDGEEW